MAMMISPPTCSPNARDTPLGNDKDDDEGNSEETETTEQRNEARIPDWTGQT